jgi:sortase A
MNTILSWRLGRAMTAILLACGILAAAAVGQGMYTQLTSHPLSPSPIGLAPLEEGDLVGRVIAPRVGLDSPVFEGVSNATLARGPGHVPSTPLPGVGQSLAHALIVVSRGADGSRVARLHIGDAVEMRTPFGLRRYRVMERRLSEPEQARFQAQAREGVSLVTPFPPEELGPAPLRLALILDEEI